MRFHKVSFPMEKTEKSEWNDYWKSKSLKRRFIELIRKIYLSKIYTRHVLKYSSPGDSIIETGCGSGTYLKYFKKKGRTCFGLDNSMESIKLSKKNCDNVVFGDMKDLPFRDNSFVVNFNQGVMEHFSDAKFKEYLQELKRVSKNVVIIVPCKWSFWRVYDFIGDDPDKRFFSKKEIHSLMKSEFDTIKVRYLWESGFLSLVAIGIT